ncbi:hypothetical protein VNO77_19375 [Canavalia gladiata]|uniref:Uncharacterized protein n=1 Tax=Canavalia gladiata TaxID=3824 RepID=A0AAN9LMD6_CANGL
MRNQQALNGMATRSMAITLTSLGDAVNHRPEEEFGNEKQCTTKTFGRWGPRCHAWEAATGGFLFLVVANHDLSIEPLLPALGRPRFGGSPFLLCS